MKNYKLDTKKIISTLVAAGVLATGMINGRVVSVK